ncbi:MAG TPA: ester cyclase [Gemmatimonadaceae bacterium]|jgi:Predicted ester cyclase
MAADKSKRGANERDEGQTARGQRAGAGPSSQGTARTGGDSTAREREQRISTTREGVETRGRSAVEENSRLARTIYDLWNERDFDQAVHLATENIECVNIPFNTTTKGPEGYREFMQSWVTAFPDGRIDVKRVIADENGAVVEFTGRGTHTGPLEGPMGTIQPTQRSGELALCDVLEIERGKVRRVRSYFDSATLMRQLGLLEEMPAGKSTAAGSQPRSR